MDCNLPGSSVHGIFQARVLEWGAIAFSDPMTVTGQKNNTIGQRQGEDQTEGTREELAWLSGRHLAGVGGGGHVGEAVGSGVVVAPL